MKRIALHAGGFLFVLALVLAQWLGGKAQVKQAVAQPAVTVPFLEEWSSSGHADAEAEAFRHWDEEEEKQVPESCAACHSTPGYLDFIGGDGSEAGKVDKPAPLGTTVECAACHNDVTLKMDSVVMPSGVEITGLGREARCMVCHQGRASKAAVDGAIEKLNLTDVDAVNEELGFINIHYYAAAATKYGTVAKGGYEYDGKSYDANFAHIEGYVSCIECHNPHTLKVKFDECSTCHTGLESDEDLKKIRMKGSGVDYDGDSDIEEGIYYEIVGLQDLLYQAIQAYANEKSSVAIAYESHTYPYFFIDTNQNGQAEEDEAKYPNRYNAWTARLLKVAYNYQLSMKDPGMFAHGGKYVIQLLTDSLEDVNSVLSIPVEMKATRRIDAGHFAGSEEAFRHWDAEGEVPSSCTKCHQADGLPLFLKDNATISMPPSNGFKCTTCHNDLTTYSLYEVKEVVFPSGTKVTSEDANTNLCMNCHQGRESTVSVNRVIKDLDEDAVSEKLRFMNVHYFAAGATKFGTEAKGAYEYEGKEYVGLFKHVPNYTGCTSCHGAHELEINKELCSMCHQQVKDGGSVEAIRMVAPDYDGDGDTTEGVAAELDAMHEELYAAIQEYAKNVVKTDIVYDSHNYPYFFNDTNGNGQPDPDEANRDNGYNTWTPKLLKAAYNYQYVAKDPGGFAHNGKYIAQLLHDSLEDLGTLKEGMTRP
jgi:hypothetical protein